MPQPSRTHAGSVLRSVGSPCVCGTCSLKQRLSDIMPRAGPAGPRGSGVSVTAVAEGTSFGSVRKTLVSDGYWTW